MNWKIHVLMSVMFIPFPVLAVSSTLPAPIQALVKKGFELKGQFTQPPAIKGYVMEYQGQGTTVFVMPDKQHTLIGNLMDNMGNDLSSPQVEKYVYSPMAKNLWQKLEKSYWITDGKDNALHKIYVFFDPYCPYCTEFWHKAQPWVDSGKVQLRLLPVAILRPESKLKAAAIMMSDNPNKALHDYESMDGKSKLHKPTSIPSDISDALQKNLELMEVLGSNATPGIYYLSSRKRLQQQLGLPADEDIMNTIMGGQP